jgi:hypothetical protein
MITEIVLPNLTHSQEKAVNDCSEWLIKVFEKQGRWLNENDLWIAYPFKRTGMNRAGFNLILSTLKTNLENEINKSI